MSLVFFEGFELGLPAAPKWDTFNWFYGWGQTGRRASTYGFNTYWFSYGTKQFAFGMKEFIFGIAIQPVTGGTGQYIIEFYEGGTGGTKHLQFGFTGANVNFRGARGDGTVLFTDTTTNGASAWVFWEIRCVIDNTNGSIVVKRNEIEVQNLTGIDTTNGSSSPGEVDSFRIVNPTSGANVVFDDLYMIHIDGSGVNDWIGDCMIDELVPTSNATVAWTPSAGSNYQCVDEAGFNTTDYVSSSTVDQVDLYNFENLASTPDYVYGVMANVYATEDVAGLRKVAPVVQMTVGSPENNYVGGELTLSTGWQELGHLWEKNPDTDALWTPGELDALVLGVKVTE